MSTRPDVPGIPDWGERFLGEANLDEAGAEEELPSGAAPWWLLQTRRARQVAAALLVVAATTGLVGLVATHRAGGRGDLSVAPPAAAPEVPGPLGNLTVVGNQSLLRIISSLPAQCAKKIPCTLAAAIPPSTTEAIGQYLAGADERGMYTVTQTGTNQLVYRAVNAIAGDLELLVIVQIPDAAVSPATETSDPSPGAAIRYARRQIGRFEVQVQYTGPPGSTPPVDLAVRLSEDPRLLELG